MKHKLLYIFPVLAALFGFAACSSEDITDGGQPAGLTGDEVIVKAGIGANSVFTRSNPIGTTEEQKHFNANDIILIYDEAGKYGIYKLDAQGTWNFYNPKVSWDQSLTYFGPNCKPMVWDDNQKKTFYAAYPQGDSRWDGTQRRVWYQGVNSYSSMVRDQSTLDGLAQADVMYAEATFPEKPKDNTITFNFVRQTARVIVKLKYNNQFSGLNPQVDNLRFSGSFSLPSGEDSWEDNYFKPYYDSANDEYVVLLFPMQADATKKFMDLTVKYDGNTDGDPLTLTGTPTLEKGKSYTFNVLVGKEKMSIESVTVNNWEKEDVLPGGSLEANPLASVTTEDVGKVVTANGKMYDNKEAAQAAGENPIAMITYAGATGDSKYNHGFAIALNNASSSQTTQYGEETSLDNVDATLAAFAAANPAPSMSGSWKIPGVKDLERIFYQTVMNDLIDGHADQEHIDQEKENWEEKLANPVPTSEETFDADCGTFFQDIYEKVTGKKLVHYAMTGEGNENAVAWGGILTSTKCDNGMPYLYVTTVESFKTFKRIAGGEDDPETQSFLILPIFAF